MKALHMIAFSLVVIGGLSVGLSAIGVDLIGQLISSLGAGQIFNVLVGVSAAFLVVTHMQDCKACISKK